MADYRRYYGGTGDPYSREGRGMGTGRFKMFLIIGLGMALFDVVGGWLLWAPFTLVIVGLMGYSVGAICENRRSLAAYAVALTVACLIKVVGYYAAEGLIYGNWIAPLTSIPGNLVQIGVASGLVLPVVGKLRKHVTVFSLAENRK